MTFAGWSSDFAKIITRDHALDAVLAVIILIVGFYLARKMRDAVAKIPQFDIQQRLLATKIVYYTLVTLAIAAALTQIGVDLRVLLGAAGVLTVAVGFAAQTSASNLISGLFLMAEKPFVVGDVVAIGDIRGEVMSIDLLSTKIRTFTNLMVRVPNETMVKSNITNYSYFPIRRLDLNIGVGYESNLTLVESVLRQVASSHPLCLEDPRPVFVFNGFGDSAMNIQFQVWTLTKNMTTLQNDLSRDAKVALDAAGIAIPFPTRTLVMAQQGPSPVARL